MHVKTNISTQHTSNLLSSKSTFETRLNNATTTEGSFGTRSVSLNKAPSLSNRLWTMLHHYIGHHDPNEEPIEQDKQKPYLLGNLVQLLGEEKLSERDKMRLQNLIHRSDTFNNFIKNEDSITPEVLMDLRMEIQLDEEFLSNANPKELEDILENPNLSNSERNKVLYHLGIAYKKFADGDIINYKKIAQHYEKAFELGLEGLNTNQKHHILNTLINYSWRANASKSKDPNNTLIQTYTNAFTQLLKQEKTDDSKIANLLSLIEQSNNRSSTLETLLSNAPLWTSPNQVTIDQWQSIINSPNPLATLKNLAANKETAGIKET